MPTNVACPKCSTKYKLPDKLLGKAVKCQKCGASFKVAAKTQATAGQTKPAGGRTAAQTNELAKFGLDGPIDSGGNDIFDSPPSAAPPMDMLGNHALDPGFTPPQTKDDDSEVDPNELFVNPALAPKKKKKMSIDSYQPTRERLDSYDGEPFVFKDAIKLPWFILLMVLGLVTLACTVIPYLMGPEYAFITFIGMSIIGFVASALNIWGLILAYKTSGTPITLVLCLLVPFYFLYYTIVNWDKMKPYGQAIIVCVVLSILHIPFIFLNAY